jgi:hypothetical protein
MHYIIIVSPTTNFPEFNKEMRLSDVTTERGRFYYFHIRSNNPIPDDLGKLLKSANPKRLDVNNPEGFRRALASFISDLRSAAR